MVMLAGTRAHGALARTVTAEVGTGVLVATRKQSRRPDVRLHYRQPAGWSWNVSLALRSRNGASVGCAVECGGGLLACREDRRGRTTGNAAAPAEPGCRTMPAV